MDVTAFRSELGKLLKTYQALNQADALAAFVESLDNLKNEKEKLLAKAKKELESTVVEVEKMAKTLSDIEMKCLGLQKQASENASRIVNEALAEAERVITEAKERDKASAAKVSEAKDKLAKIEEVVAEKASELDVLDAKLIKTKSSIAELLK